MSPITLPLHTNLANLAHRAFRRVMCDLWQIHLDHSQSCSPLYVISSAKLLKKFWEKGYPGFNSMDKLLQRWEVVESFVLLLWSEKNATVDDAARWPELASFTKPAQVARMLMRTLFPMLLYFMENCLYPENLEYIWFSRKQGLWDDQSCPGK